MTLSEGIQVKADVEWMILEQGTTAQIYRATETDKDFYGSYESSESAVGDPISIEMKYMKPEDLIQIHADAVASVYAGCSILEHDILLQDGIRYRVTEVKPQNHFGTITHMDLHLELIKQDYV